MEITRHGGAVGEDRALHQRVAADKVMPHELLHADAPVQPGHDRTPLDVILGTGAQCGIHITVHAGICGVTDQVRRTAVEQRVQHVVVATGHPIHHPRLDHAVMVDEIVQRHRDAVPRRVGGAHLEVVRRVMAEHQARHRPVGHLLGRGENAVRQQVFEAFGAALVAFAAGHAMLGMRAFVAFIAGEHVQIRAVQRDAVRGDLTEVAAHVIRRKLGAQVRLAPTGPHRVLGHRAVRQSDRIARVERARGEVIVAVLVMRAEQVSLLMTGVDQRSHALPAAGLAACGQIVGMAVVVAGLRPAVQMQVQPPGTHFVQRAHLPLALRERDERIILAGLRGIIERRVRLNFRLDADMHP